MLLLYIDLIIIQSIWLYNITTIVADQGLTVWGTNNLCWLSKHVTLFYKHMYTYRDTSLTSSDTATHKWYKLRILLSIFKTKCVFQLIVGCKVYYWIRYCHHSAIESKLINTPHLVIQVAKSIPPKLKQAWLFDHSASYSQITYKTATFWL